MGRDDREEAVLSILQKVNDGPSPHHGGNGGFHAFLKVVQNSDPQFTNSIHVFTFLPSWLPHFPDSFCSLLSTNMHEFLEDLIIL